MLTNTQGNMLMYCTLLRVALFSNSCVGPWREYLAGYLEDVVGIGSMMDENLHHCCYEGVVLGPFSMILLLSNT